MYVHIYLCICSYTIYVCNIFVIFRNISSPQEKRSNIEKKVCNYETNVGEKTLQMTKINGVLFVISLPRRTLTPLCWVLQKYERSANTYIQVCCLKTYATPRYVIVSIIYIYANVYIYIYGM